MSKLILLCVFLFPFVATGQSAQNDDPCGAPSHQGVEPFAWSYSLSDFSGDLLRWSSNPNVGISTIGRSVQGRLLYMLTITNPATMLSKKRIHIHARTHPNESESSHVAREIIDELLSNSPLARQLLDHCVFQIVPMYNPDGVHLGKARENANGIDIESNWNTFPHQPEVEALKRQFTTVMASDPVIVSLNLHSAYHCKRYFVYHAAAGTSILFTQLQQRFINMVRSRFPGGVEPFDFFVSWTASTPKQYPESWFWLNHRENVMALTYEDMNCAEAGDFDKTARALLGGVGEYVGVFAPVTSVADIPAHLPVSIDAVYPNPVRLSGTAALRLTVQSPAARVRMTLTDALGREVQTLWDGEASSGTHVIHIPTQHLATGVYHVAVRSGEGAALASFVVVN